MVAPEPDPALVAAVSANATSRLAHHEAGHAVATVARGGELVAVHLGYVDWSTSDLSGDKPGETRGRTEFANQPFATFAGPWAEAMWTVEHDPDVDDFAEALDYAWDNNIDGDAATYEDRVELLTQAAAQLGFPLARVRAWEFEWVDELEPLWPAVCEVAALLIDGQAVTHDVVLAIIDRVVDDDA
jgi:hypothetical protein